MNNKILIIGNGSSVLSQKLGDKINEISIIARINNYQINGYEDYIGSKTDIWINGANSKLILPTSIPNEVFVFLALTQLMNLPKYRVQTGLQKRL